MRTFAYTRVSTTEQDSTTQLYQMRQRGFDIEEHRCISDTVSGSVATSERPGFRELMVRMERGDALVVLKLDRLGRDAMDVQATVDALIEKGVKVHCLDLPVSDLSSAEGRLMLQVFGAFAEFERNRIRERTKETLAKKKAEGVKLGRPVAVETTVRVQECKAFGLTQSQTAKEMGVSLRTVKGHWNKEGALA